MTSRRIYANLLYLIIFFSCFTYAGTIDIGIRLFPSDALLYVALIMFLFIFDKKGFQKRDYPIFILLLAFVLIHFISVSYVSFFVESSLNVTAAKEFIRIVAPVIFTLLLIVSCRSNLIHIMGTIKAFVYSGLFTGLYGIYQFLSYKIIGKYYPFIPNSSDIPNFNGRGVGTFFEAGYHVLFLGVAAGLLIYLYQSKLTSKRFFYISLIIFLAAIAATESTIGIIAVMISVCFYFFFRKKWTLQELKSKKMIAMFLVAVVALAAAVWRFSDKIIGVVTGFSLLFSDGIEDFNAREIGMFSAADRLVKILKGLWMFFDHPIFGVGIRQYSSNYLDYPPRAVYYGDLQTVVPLNVYIELLAELGIIGFALFFIIMLFLFLRLNLFFKSILIFILLNFFTYPSYKMFFIWIVVGIFYLVSNNQKETQS